MKIVKWLVLVLLALALLVFAAEYYASESGEVVVLETRDADGNPMETRLWVVDYDGDPWLRAGSAGSGWAERITAAETVAVTRNNIRRSYRPDPDPAAREEVNRLMAEKYAWREQLIGTLVGGRDQSLPIRLRTARD
ncbi:MAG: hypothetical protein AAGG11_19220 [Pseudomonadota bacterium]